MYNGKSYWPARLSRGVAAALGPRESAESQNAWNLYAEIAWFGVLAGVAASFLSVFVLRLGGSDTQVGLLSALPALVAILVSIPGSRLVDCERRPLPVLVTTATLHRAGYLAIGLLPSFVFFEQAWFILILVVLLTVPAAIANIAFTTMFGRVVEPGQRAHVVSVRNVLVGITSTGAALIGGKFLDWVVFPINYQILFALAFAASMVSTYYLTRIQLPPATVPEPSKPAGAGNGLHGYLAMLNAGPGYTRFALVSFICHWGLFFTAPLYSLYWIRIVDATEGWVGLITMVTSATTIFFYPLWGRLAARRGNRIVMIATMAGLGGYPFLMALSPTVEWMLFVAFWGGVFGSGQALAFFNGLLEVCPEENRAGRVAAYNTLANIAAFASPLISTSLTFTFGIPAMLVLGSGFRLLGAFLIWQQRVLEPVRGTVADHHSPNAAFFGKMETERDS